MGNSMQDSNTLILLGHLIETLSQVREKVQQEDETNCSFMWFSVKD